MLFIVYIKSSGNTNINTQTHTPHVNPTKYELVSHPDCTNRLFEHGAEMRSDKLTTKITWVGNNYLVSLTIRDLSSFGEVKTNICIATLFFFAVLILAPMH